MIVTAKQGNKITDDDDRLFRKEMKNVRDEEVFEKFESVFKEENMEGNRGSSKQEISESYFTRNIS